MAFIYTIRNIITNQYYVGESLHVQERWDRHLEDLRLNHHHSHKLQRSFNKYGITAFEFKIECEVDDDKRFEKEKEIIEKYNSFINGFNETSGGDNPGFEALEKRVYCYDYEGNFLNKSYKSGREASRDLDIDQALLQRICTGQSKSAYGKDNIRYRFSYKLVNKLEPINEFNHNAKRLGQFDENGNLIQIFNSCKDAIKFLNIKSTKIYKAIKQNNKYHNFYWRYIN